MIDLHCHVLPAIDDGPSSMEEALALARIAVANGIGEIVATPHISWDYPSNDSTLVHARVAALNLALVEAAIPLTVHPGAEIALTRALDIPDAELTAMRLGGGRYLLVECPLTPSATGFERGLWQVRGRGHEVVLAHPERSPGLRQDITLIERLVRDGMLTQITASSLSGRFGKDVQRFSHQLLEAGLVHTVASDAHSARRRPPSIAAEMEEAGLSEHGDVLSVQAPRAILAGEAVPPAPRVRRRRRRFFVMGG